MNLFILITTIFVGSGSAFAQSGASVEYNELNGSEKLYFSVNAPGISGDNTYEVEVIVDQPDSYSLTYDPFYSHESSGYLIAKDQVLISAQQIKTLITDNPSDYYNEEIQLKMGLVCASINVRINTVGFITFDTIMRMEKFLVCLDAKNNKMMIGNKKAVGTYKNNGIEATLDFK